MNHEKKTSYELSRHRINIEIERIRLKFAIDVMVKVALSLPNIKENYETDIEAHNSLMQITTAKENQRIMEGFKLPVITTSISTFKNAPETLFNSWEQNYTSDKRQLKDQFQESFSGSLKSTKTPKLESQNDNGIQKDDTVKEDEVNMNKEKRNEQVGPNAYMKRNVYKSIIRHMAGYLHKNYLEAFNMLTQNGYDKPSIESAFKKIKHFNELEKQKRNPKRSQLILSNILKTKSPCTYILKETLIIMRNAWESGKLGRITEENLKIYNEVCQAYYYDAVKTLN